jgi:hypothetical protein
MGFNNTFFFFIFKVKSALFPKTNKAPNIIDLPAPVSPVMKILLKMLNFLLTHSFYR